MIAMSKKCICQTLVHTLGIEVAIKDYFHETRLFERTKVLPGLDIANEVKDQQKCGFLRFIYPRKS